MLKTLRRAAGRSSAKNTVVQEQLEILEADEDIQQEAQRLADMKLGIHAEQLLVRNISTSSTKKEKKLTIEENPFILQKGSGGHRASAATVRLLDEIGGTEGLRTFTNAFYQQFFFLDPHLDRLLRDHSEPHGTRFAAWIAEKFGDPSTPWTVETSARGTCPFRSHGHELRTPHDRSSAHFAAWHSPKRPPADFGKHFKLDDARVWMRLHFAALRQTGGFERSPAFCDYYIKFIGHFVSVYEATATQFARESARWSEDSRNVEDYIANGRRMEDVIGASYARALQDLPEEEASNLSWPYPTR